MSIYIVLLVDDCIFCEQKFRGISDGDCPCNQSRRRSLIIKAQQLPDTATDSATKTIS